MRETLKRTVLLVAVAVALFAFSGCATYWRNRGEDFADMCDLGLTFAKKPQWVFYQSFESVAAVGYSDFEATFVGWGGGRVGITPHYLKAWGALLWADEQVGWADYDTDDPNTLYAQSAGLAGMPAGMVTGKSNPHYVPT